MSLKLPVTGYRTCGAVGRISVYVMAASLAALVGFGQVAYAAPIAPAASGFGCVDTDKVLAGSKCEHDAQAQMQALQALYQSADSALHQYCMLSTEDLDSLSTLLLVSTPTADDTSKINTLEGKSKVDYDALAHLQQVKDADQTADDKTKMGVLTQEYQNAQQAIGTIEQDYTAKLKAKADDLTQTDDKQLRAAVAKVAAKQGLAVVFTTQVAIYAANDITEAVAAEMAK